MTIMLNEKDKEQTINNIMINKAENDIEFYIKNQSNNNLERFKNLTKRVKSGNKKNHEINKTSADSKNLFNNKLLISHKSISNSNNKNLKKEEKKFEYNNNFDNSLNECTKNFVLLSPIRKSINLEKVNLNNSNYKKYENNELLSGQIYE